VVNYDLCPSSYGPSSLSTTQEGWTAFTWVANNPNPSTECGGYTPVPVQTFRGSSSSQAIFNKGNDTMAGTYSNDHGSGPVSLETNLVITPTAEDLALNTPYNANGFGPPGDYASVLFIQQTLLDAASYDPPDPNGNKFTGRQVYETAGSGTPKDDCYTGTKAHGYLNPGGPFVVRGSIWNVGGLFSDAGNVYGSDQLGWTIPVIGKHRLALAGLLPCTATAYQSMVIVNNISGFSNEKFATHTLKLTLYPLKVVVSKDGLTSTYNH
jgi:hypothetical protein